MPGPLQSAGGFEQPIEIPTPVDPLSLQRAKLRQLHAELTRLRIQDIETRVAIRFHRRRLDSVVLATRDRRHGPLEDAQVQQSAREFARQIVRAHTLQQRLLKLRRDTRVAAGLLTFMKARS